jgi:hypothetical protein
MSIVERLFIRIISSCLYASSHLNAPVGAASDEYFVHWDGT